MLAKSAVPMLDVYVNVKLRSLLAEHPFRNVFALFAIARLDDV